MGSEMCIRDRRQIRNGRAPLGTFPMEIPCPAMDISYVWTREGWLYLAVILDLHSRRVIGWAVSNRMKHDLAIRALKMAIAFRQPPEGCIHHTDRGSQYCSHDYQKILRQNGFKVSMSGKGNCYDNAAVETFFKTIKAELIWRRSRETRRQAEMAIFEYINGFYNPRRRHSALGWKSPVAFENPRWPKRALGAARKRDRSIQAFEERRETKKSPIII